MGDRGRYQGSSATGPSRALAIAATVIALIGTTVVATAGTDRGVTVAEGTAMVVTSPFASSTDGDEVAGPDRDAEPASGAAVVVAAPPVAAGSGATGSTAGGSGGGTSTGGATRAGPPPPIRDTGPPPGVLDLGRAPFSGPSGRAVLAVKVSNTSRDRPQAGLLDADVVFEELTEAGITRFIALFQSVVPANVGPIRSGRLVDADILPAYGNTIAISGARQDVLDRFDQAGFTTITERSGLMRRSSARKAPHNLYASGERLYQGVPAPTMAARTGWVHDDAVPPSQCDPPPPPPSEGPVGGLPGGGGGGGGSGTDGGTDGGGDGGDPSPPPDDDEDDGPLPDLPGPGGMRAAQSGEAHPLRCRRAEEYSVAMSSANATGWQWDAGQGGYRRFQNGARHLDEGGVQIGAANVLVLGVRISDGGCCDSAGNHLTRTEIIGSGTAVLLRDGRRYDVAWSKDSAGDSIHLTDDAGATVPLRNGPTWVLLTPRENVT